MAKMRLCLMLFVALAACISCTARRIFETNEDYPDLPSDAARGYSRSLLAGRAKVVTVGYQTNAQFKVPAGSKDALPIFSKAMDKVVENGGGVLSIGAGTYIFSSQFFIRTSKVKVQGAGMFKTILKLADNAEKFAKVGFLSGKNITGVTVTGLTLDGNKQNQVDDEVEIYGRYGLYISPSDNVLIDNVRVINFQMYGIDPPARNVDPAVSYSGSQKRTLTVINCNSSYNNYDGFIFDTSVGIYAANNYAEGNGRFGINLVTGSWNALVEKNTLRKNGFGPSTPRWKALGGNGCGIGTNSNEWKGNMYVSTNISIQGNQVYGSKRGGICSGLTKDLVVQNNVFEGGEQCALLTQNDGVKFVGNQCSKTKTGIVNDQNKKAVIDRNTCDGKACK